MGMLVIVLSTRRLPIQEKCDTNTTTCLSLCSNPDVTGSTNYRELDTVLCTSQHYPVRILNCILHNTQTLNLFIHYTK